MVKSIGKIAEKSIGKNNFAKAKTEEGVWITKQAEKSMRLSEVTILITKEYHQPTIRMSAIYVIHVKSRIEFHTSRL